MKIEQVVTGEQSFSAFALGARRDFERLALYVLRRQRRASDDPDFDDVVQELMLEAWLRARGGERKPGQPVPAWDSARGANASKYCTFNAVVQARRFLKREDRMRGIGRGRVDLAPDEERALPEAPAPETQEYESEVSRLIEQVLADCKSPREVIFCVVCREVGEPSEAARLIYRNPELRAMCRLGSEGQARAAARSIVRRLARQAAGS